MSRITAVYWNDGYRNVLGHNWAGNYDWVQRHLSDLQADGEMLEAKIVRLPRRCVLDYRGRVYLSEAERVASVNNRIRDALARDMYLC